MKEPRAQILGTIARASARSTRAKDLGTAIEAVAEPDHRSRAPRFCGRLREVDAVVDLLGSISAVPAAVAKHIAALHIYCDDDPDLAALDWAAEGISLKSGIAPLADAQPTVGRCLCAVAETGSVLLSTNSASRPFANLVASQYFVVVYAGQIVERLEDAWKYLGGAVARARSTVFVTGPSRTRDIEQRSEVGVHGALRMHVLLIGADRDTTA